MIDSNQLSLEAINKKSEDYFFNMDFVVRNIEKMRKIVNQYNIMFKDAVTIKKIYSKMINQYLEKIKNENIQDSFKMLGRDSYELKCEEIFNNIDILKGYYTTLKSRNIKLSDDKIYGKQVI
jgi:hypothetical protein